MKFETPEAAILAYFEGSFKYDKEQLESALSPDASIEGFTGDVYVKMGRDPFITRIAAFPDPKISGAKYDKKILQIMKTKNTAVARAKTLVGDSYYADFFALLKIKDSWVIMRKIFTTEFGDESK